jgi:hypothetical protein
MLASGYAFVVRSGDIRKREISRLILIRVPRVGEQIVEVTADGEPRKRYIVEEVATYLWPSGQDRLVADNELARPYGEIVLRDLSLAEKKGKKVDNAPFVVPAGVPESFSVNLSNGGETFSPEGKKKGLNRIPDEAAVEDDDIEPLE